MASSLLSSLSLPKPNLIIKATSSTQTTTTSPVETLDQKFGRKGIKFTDAGNNSAVELTHRDGSSVKLQIANGHVTSYKPKVYWKEDGFEEILYTIPSDESSRGGIGLVVNNLGDGNSKGPGLLNLSDWTVKDVDSDSIDALQVELSCTSGTLDLTYVVTLYEHTIATAVIVKNTGRMPVNLTAAILNHFKFKRRSRTAIQGLLNSTYCTHPPLSSPFSVLTPAEAMKAEEPGWFSFGWEPEKKPGVWSVQPVPLTLLKHKVSRVYAAPPEERLKPFYTTIPTKYETIDQGKELFFRVIRMGFEDIYVSSPGSLSEKYGKDYFICTASASMLVPVCVKPGEQWRGAQVIEHDNL